MKYQRILGPFSRRAQRWRTLLWALGLALLTAVHDEARKVAVHKSWRSALSLSAIHLVPASVSLGIVVIDILGRFIGRELEGPQGQDDLRFALLQVAAKVQVSWYHYL